LRSENLILKHIIKVRKGISLSQHLTRNELIAMILEEHSAIIDELIENIKMYAGKGQRKKLLMSPGFKIVHKETGLNYTVSGIESTDSGPVLVTLKPTGEEFRIKKSDLKHYERL
tara:strand:- start:278 stop:622 length:345 start_codon:yes stop_codon:yes gene_type:complete